MFIATENPIELHGTIPCRKLTGHGSCSSMCWIITRDEERAIVKRHGHRATMPKISDFDIRPVADLNRLEGVRQALSSIRLSDDLVDYVVDLIRNTRETPVPAGGRLTRAANMLATSSRAKAVLQGATTSFPMTSRRLRCLPCATVWSLPRRRDRRSGYRRRDWPDRRSDGCPR